jgi:L-lactate dehydrogenase
VFLQVLDPERFGGRESFLRETRFFAKLCQETPVPPGKPPVRLPGQAALLRRKEQLANGVVLYPGIIPALVSWATQFGVALPLTLTV